jgi:hypothetical protein
VGLFSYLLKAMQNEYYLPLATLPLAYGLAFLPHFVKAGLVIKVNYTCARSLETNVCVEQVPSQETKASEYDNSNPRDYISKRKIRHYAFDA